jgi:cytidylate kinase
MSQPRVLINVIGKPGTGKSLASEYIAATFKIPISKPSDVLRAYARDHDIPLRLRRDYVACNRALNDISRYAIIAPILSSDDDRCIDGLRSFGCARYLARTVGMHTLALVCDDDVRVGRIRLRQRDEAAAMTPEAIMADEAESEVNSDLFLPNTELVMGMHDVSDSPIDTNRPESEWLEEAVALVRPYFVDL